MKQAKATAGVASWKFLRRAVLAAAIGAVWNVGAHAHGGMELRSAEPEIERVVVRAYFKDLSHAHKIVHSRFETLESKYEKGYLIVHASAAEIEELKSLGYRIETDSGWVDEMAKMLTEENLGKALDAEGKSIPNYACYETVEETFTAAQNIVNTKPNLASWTKVGSSWEQSTNRGGYDIRVLKLTNSATSGTKPKLFINSAIHAREYATAPLVLAFAKQLVDGYGVDADATWILDHHEVHLMLHTNPDGRKKAESGILWRKNTNTAYCGATSNSRGADLNRNFTYQWNSTGGNGSSGSVCAETYRGPSAASEPETKAIEAYVRSLWPDRRGPGRNDPAPLDTSGIHLDIHSHGRLLLWPWGTNGTVAPNDTQLTTLGRKFSYFNNHTPQRSLDLYETDGTSDGVSYGELGVAAFTFELGTAFFESCNYFTNTLKPANLPALLYAAKVVRTPYQTPAGPDAVSVAVSSGSVPAGTPVTLTAQINDTRYNNSNGTETTQNIAAAEYYVDTPPWAGGTAIPMTASDGAFNTKIESVTATINTTGWTSGKHLIYVRGKDTANNWGAISAVFLTVDNSGNTNPVANFDYSASGLTVNFTDRSTDNGSITARNWTFGDGGTSTAANPSHTYAAAGTYSVSLKVTDNDGNTNTTTKSVTVSGDDVPTLTNGQTVSNLSDAQGGWKYYKVNIPSGASNLVIKISGGSGDADLYTRIGSKPDTANYKCRPYTSGNNETCSDAAPPAGPYYIGIRGYRAYSGLSLSVNYTGTSKQE